MSVFLPHLILLITNLVALLSAQIRTSTSPIDVITTNYSYLPKWLLLEENLKHLSRGVANNLRPYFMEAVLQRNITSRCVEQSLHVLDGMEEMKLWAIRFLDSSAKQIDGVLDGTWASLGRYDECLSTMVTGEALRHKSREYSSFTGRYCLMALKPHISETKYFPFGNPPIEELRNISESDSAISVLAKHSNAYSYLPILFGVCVPSGCDQQDVNKIASYVGEQNGIIIGSASCKVKEENQYTPVIISLLFCYGFLIFLAIIGTFFDVYEKRSHTSFSGAGMRLLMAFSVKTNFKNLFAIKKTGEGVKCLHGIRVLTMFWLVIGHGFSFRPLQLSHNVLSVGNAARTFLGQFIINGTFAVDSFFFLGGCLVGYIAMKYHKKANKLVTFPQYVMLRLCRFFPSLLFIVTFTLLVPLLTSGPMWGMMYSSFVKPCRRAWWRIFFFLYNVYDVETLCLPPLWYVSCDMQLYIIAFIFLALLIKKTKFGVAITITAIIASMIYAAAIAYVENFPPMFTLDLMMDFQTTAISNMVIHLYLLPVGHIGSYFTGLMIGVYLATKPEIKLSKTTLTMGWCLAIMINMSVIFGMLSWNRGKTASIAEAVIYNSCARVAWALSLAWLVICCALGYGGIINHILSWNMWTPLSRLSFLVYIIHPLMQMATTGAIDTVLPSKHLFMLRSVVADITISYVCAIALYLIVEAPFSNIASLLFPIKSELKKDEIAMKVDNHHNSQINNHAV